MAEFIKNKTNIKKSKGDNNFPKIAHSAKNIGRKTIYLVSAQNTIYNPKNPDTFSYLIRK